MSDWMGAGLCVRQGGAGAGGDDGIEGRLFGAEQAHTVFDLGGESGFGDAGPDLPHRLREGSGIEYDRAADEIDFLACLDHSESLDEARYRLERRTQRK